MYRFMIMGFSKLAVPLACIRGPKKIKVYKKWPVKYINNIRTHLPADGYVVV